MLLRRSHRFPMQSAISNNRTAPRRLFRSTQSNVSSQCALPKKSPFKSVAIQGRGEPMGISTVDLYQIAGFNTDQVAGFQAQLASGRWKRQVLWPEHLKGKRYEDFCYGSSVARDWMAVRSEEHTSELQSLMRNSYAVFCF